ncbi:MAG: hypothetical protein H7199_10915 [Burkholderiales bacterium]|nr:hypothetical protein [Flavobacterium sp.]
MSNIVKNYFSVLEGTYSLNCDLEGKYRLGRKIKIPDLEMIALSLNAELRLIDSELIIYSVKKGQISSLIE